jgi:hypothetical protein
LISGVLRFEYNSIKIYNVRYKKKNSGDWIISTKIFPEMKLIMTNKTGRREFLKKGLSLGLVAGGSLILGRADLLLAKDLQQGEPDAMF